MGPKKKNAGKKKKNAGHAASTAGDGASTSQETSTVNTGTPVRSRLDDVSKLDDEKQEQQGSGAVPDCPTGITLHERTESLESEVTDLKAEMKTIVVKNFEDPKIAEKTTHKNVEDLAPVIKDLTSAIEDLTPAIKDWTLAIKDLTPAIKELTTAVENEVAREQSVQTSQL